MSQRVVMGWCDRFLYLEEVQRNSRLGSWRKGRGGIRDIGGRGEICVETSEFRVACQKVKVSLFSVKYRLQVKMKDSKQLLSSQIRWTIF